jgi:large subunit ribosomal protein L31
MKKDIHPKSRPTVFKDTSTGKMFLVQSTVKTDQTVVYEDGNSYPVVMLSISSDSHPFFTGAQKYVDELGRIEKFKRKYKV